MFICLFIYLFIYLSIYPLTDLQVALTIIIEFWRLECFPYSRFIYHYPVKSRGIFESLVSHQNQMSSLLCIITEILPGNIEIRAEISFRKNFRCADRQADTGWFSLQVSFNDLDVKLNARSVLVFH